MVTYNAGFQDVFSSFLADPLLQRPIAKHHEVRGFVPLLVDAFLALSEPFQSPDLRSLRVVWFPRSAGSDGTQK